MEDNRSVFPCAFLDITFDDPKSNLDFDEFLLTQIHLRRILRIWESKKYFIVMGRSSSEDDLNLSYIKKDKIVVVRRKSGGGTVVQGPGCLNYTFVSDVFPEATTVKKAFEWVLSRLIAVINEVLGLKVVMRGTSDLCLGDRKFSGNAQRRKGSRFYVHGTLLYNFDLPLMDRFLALPQKRPSYRGERTNRDFLVNLSELKWKKKDFIGRMKHEYLNW